MGKKINLGYTRADREKTETEDCYKPMCEMSPAEKKAEMEKVRYPEIHLWDLKPIPGLEAGDTVVITAKVKEVQHVEKMIKGKKEVETIGADFEAHMLEVAKADSKKPKKSSTESMADEISSGLDAVMEGRK